MVSIVKVDFVWVSLLGAHFGFYFSARSLFFFTLKILEVSFIVYKLILCQSFSFLSHLLLLFILFLFSAMCMLRSIKRHNDPPHSTPSFLDSLRLLPTELCCYRQCNSHFLPVVM